MAELVRDAERVVEPGAVSVGRGALRHAPGHLMAALPVMLSIGALSLYSLTAARTITWRPPSLGRPSIHHTAFEATSGVDSVTDPRAIDFAVMGEAQLPYAASRRSI